MPPSSRALLRVAALVVIAAVPALFVPPTVIRAPVAGVGYDAAMDRPKAGGRDYTIRAAAGGYGVEPAVEGRSAPAGGDISSVVQATIAALPADGGRIIVEAGGPQRAPIVIDRPGVVLDLGPDVVLAKQFDGFQIVVRAAGTTIRGGTLDGRGHDGGGIQIGGRGAGDDTLIERVRITDHGRQGIRVVGSRGVVIRGSEITKCRRSCIFGEKGAVANVIEGNVLDAASAGNDADGVQYHSTAAGKTVSGLRVVGNRITAGRTFGVEIGRFKGDVVEDVVVEGNEILGGGISLVGVRKASVRRNTVDLGGKRHGFYIELVKSSAITVEGNTCRGGGADGPATGIALNRTSDSVIDRNTIDEFKEVGIKVFGNGASNNTIRNNTVRFSGPGFGIWLHTNRRDARGELNQVKENVITGDATDGSQGVRVAGNAGVLDRSTLEGNFVDSVAEAFFHKQDQNTTRRRNRVGPNVRTVSGGRPGPGFKSDDEPAGAGDGTGASGDGDRQRGKLRDRPVPALRRRRRAAADAEGQANPAVRGAGGGRGRGRRRRAAPDADGGAPAGGDGTQ